MNQEINLEENYDHSVTYLANNCIDMQFNNKGTDHALSVIKNLFNSTEESIIMFSEKLNGAVADKPEFLTALKVYLESDKSFKLLLEILPSEDEQSEALKLIIKKSKTQSSVGYKVLSSEKLLEMRGYFSNKNNEVYHFIISDNRAFRIETDRIAFKATCNFNDVEVATDFTDLFNKFYI